MLKKAFKTYRSIIFLALALLITMILGLFRGLVERFYSTGIYVFISRFFRVLFGWIPFSIGDVIYGVAFLGLIYFIVQFIIRLLRKQVSRAWLAKVLRVFIRTVLIVYLVFQWFWGLNYHRLGSAYQLSIYPGEYSKAELIQLTDTLNSRLKAIIPSITAADTAEWMDFGKVANRCVKEYGETEKVFSFLRYSNPSVKQMLVGNIGGYGGFCGYLNPFTGEAQLNSNMPPFLRPYVACHEMGHQLGYAAEEEANMVGYLVARQSANPAVRYSVYHDLLNYAGGELYYLDSNAFKNLIKTVPALVKQHTRQERAYFSSFKNPLQPFINKWYDLYLKANNQEKGVKSYSYITAWLIAYAKKYGWNKI